MIKYEVPKERPNSFSQVLDKVSEIVEKVRKEGDRALVELTEKFDKYKLTSVKAPQEELESQAKLLDAKVREAIDEIYLQLEEFHLSIKPPNSGGGRMGIEYGVVWKPVNRVGIYVPGGAKTYPSTLLMAGIPARVAGVKEIYVSTPGEKIDPAIAYISLKLGVKELYKIGGAQAIAAMAYGTETVKRVDKVLGPGNVYVQAAKFLVSKDVGVDGIEGPTELVIIADETADPRQVALDLKAQGEHGESTFLVLISPSQKFLEDVKPYLDDNRTYYLVKTKDLDEAVKVANELSPEHLSLAVKSPMELLRLVENSGAVTLGKTPPAIVDYCAGPDHILPTNGWARFKGGVTVFDFLKPVTYVIAEKPNKKLIEAGKVLADYEGFRVHSESMGARYD
ncbi:MAG: histidinol dehydrogenase [Candidatus Aramenus sp.]|jgi:histidinol dehydrogenase|nr:histidinol dehydrogenase [Candidatus Aramenus sp.]